MNPSRVLLSRLLPRRTSLRLQPTITRPAAIRRQLLHSATPPTGSIPWPVITEISSEGWRTYDIFSKLLQERIVCLYGAIDDYLAASVVAQLLHLEAADAEKPITMYVNSPGGSISSGLAIYDTMQYVTAPVSTVVIGQASSMGALLLAGGAAGKRYALPHASVMIHQPLGGTHGQASDILIYATQMTRIREQVNHIYRRHLNRAFGHDKYDLRAVHDIMERDKYMTAEEAKEFGIVDEILTKRTDAAGVGPGGAGKKREEEKEQQQQQQQSKQPREQEEGGGDGGGGKDKIKVEADEPGQPGGKGGQPHGGAESRA